MKLRDATELQAKEKVLCQASANQEKMLQNVVKTCVGNHLCWLYQATDGKEKKNYN